MKSTSYTLVIVAGMLTFSASETLAGHPAHLPPCGVFHALGGANTGHTGIHFSTVTEAEYVEPAKTTTQALALANT